MERWRSRDHRYRRGANGIVDISPLTSMNGIVCEAIHPKLSRGLGGIPIRNFYFDGARSDLGRAPGACAGESEPHGIRAGVPEVFSRSILKD